MPTIRSNLSIPLSAIKKIDDDSRQMESDEPRRPETAFRPLCVKCGVFGAQDGSGYAEFGNTRVLAQITGPDGDGKWEENNAKITVSVKGVDESRVAELRAQLTSSVQAVVFASKYPGKVITVEVTVVSDDGGALAAALNAVTLALAHSGIENMGLVASCHVALDKNGEFVTDPSNAELADAVGGVTFGLVPNLSQTTCVDMYGRIPIQKTSALLNFAKERSIAMVPVLHKAIVNSVREREARK